MRNGSEKARDRLGARRRADLKAGHYRGYKHGLESGSDEPRRPAKSGYKPKKAAYSRPYRDEEHRAFQGRQECLGPRKRIGSKRALG
jgi:hypothetical protein